MLDTYRKEYEMTKRDAEAIAVLIKGLALGGLVVGFGALIIYSSVYAVLTSIAVAVVLRVASKFVEALAEETD